MSKIWGYIEKRLSDGVIVGWICTPNPPQTREGHEWIEVEDQPVIDGENLLLLVRGKRVGEIEKAVNI